MLFLCLTSTNEYGPVKDNDLLDELIIGVANNDKEAFNLLYEKTSVSVYSFALSILKNLHDAEDVLQDCFISIYDSAAEYRSYGKPMAWIITIVKNLCLKKLRDRKKEPEPLSDNTDISFSDNGSVTAEDKILLTMCMNVLSDEERQIVVLHAVSGFRHKEIAQILSMQLSTVLSKYNRALKKLRKNMTKGEQDV